MSAPSTPSMPDERALRRKLASATLVGSALEWFDFYLYASMAALVFGDLFFPDSFGPAKTLAAFGTFAVGFLARPIGGLVFGHLGDRIGRRNVLMATFVLMGVATGLIGLLPTYDSIGIAAPIALVALRLLQGLGSGAEYSSAAVTAYEHAEPGRRGRQAAWPVLGLNIGLLLSSLTVALLSSIGTQFLLDGGWRIPFIASFALAGIGMWVRRSIPETPEFEKSKQTHTRARRPLLQLVRNEWRALLVTMLVAFGYNALSYIFKTFSLAYLVDFVHVEPSVGSYGVTFAAAAAIITVPIVGPLIDRYGSRRVLMIAALGSAAFAFPFFMLFDTGNTWMIWLCLVFATGVLAPSMYAPQGSFVAKQFPAKVRVSGVSIGREFSGSISGGLAPVAALWIVTTSSTHATWGVSLLMLGCALMIVLGTICDRSKASAHEGHADDFAPESRIRVSATDTAGIRGGDADLPAPHAGTT